MITRFIYTQATTGPVVAYLHALLSQNVILAFRGSLGAGKTTLIRELSHVCGIIQPVTSPTFTYVHVYNNPKGQKFYHFDLYRLSTLDQFLSAGFEEYLYAPNSWAFIEWPEIIMPLLTTKVVFCEIEYWHHERKITITHE